MMGGDFQKPLHLLVSYGYCAFEGDVRVDPLDIADGRPIDAFITFLALFVGPCVVRPEIIDERLDHDVTPYVGVLCCGCVPPKLLFSRVVTVEARS